jgi:uncharacterized protein YbbK (DUF523 family)/uncharacterized protein YbgA (DUF1722 family)
MTNSTELRPIIGVSACLLGQKVRFDGGHKLDNWIANTLKSEVDFHMICPEVEMNLGIPRPPVQLQQIDNQIRMISKKDHFDHTENAIGTAQRLILNLPQLSGFILMKKSPSCGFERVKIHNENGELLPGVQGLGLFAAELKKSYPFLPIIDSGRIQDAGHRENFLRMIFIYHRFQNIMFNLSSFQEFHQTHKFIFMEYHQDLMRRLGKIAANTTKANFSEKYLEYLELMMKMLELLPSKKNRVNSLMHLLGFFKNDLTSSDKLVFMEMLDNYRNDLIPYLAVLKLLEFLSLKYQKKYILKQHLFNPFPKALMKGQ